MNKKQKRLFKIIVTHILIGIILLCNIRVNCKDNRPSIMNQESSLDDYLKRFQTHEYMKGVCKKWMSIPNHQNYNLVNSVFGEVCGTYESNNWVFLLKDKTIKNNKNFSLLVIYKDIDTFYKSQWLIKNEDLSNLIISKNSGNVRLERYYNDSTHEYSRICWSKRNSKFYITKK
jgi:hypothetical protein